MQPESIALTELSFTRIDPNLDPRAIPPRFEAKNRPKQVRVLTHNGRPDLAEYAEWEAVKIFRGNPDRRFCAQAGDSEMGVVIAAERLPDKNEIHIAAIICTWDRLPPGKFSKACDAKRLFWWMSGKAAAYCWIFPDYA